MKPNQTPTDPDDRNDPRGSSTVPTVDDRTRFSRRVFRGTDPPTPIEVVLGNTSVAVSVGAVPTVANDVLSEAAGIHGGEVHHASFRDELAVSSPFPAAVDGAVSLSGVTGIAGRSVPR
jgi:hypothetical protein